MPAVLWAALVIAATGPPQYVVALPRGAPRAFHRRLDEGLRAAPPGWDRLFIVPTPQGSVAEADPLLEPLMASPPREPRSLGVSPTRAALWPDDPAFLAGLQWGLWAPESTGALDIGAPEAWERTVGGDGLRVAVLDTGVDPDHPDLEDEGDPRGSRLTALSSVLGGEADVSDSLGHGTMVCGVVAARTNNGETRGGGIAGMAGGSGGAARGPRVLSVKITSGRASAARATDLARAIVLACEWGARAINVSFAGSARSSILRSALAWAAARGAIVVCGAGNTADHREQFPAAYAAAGLAVAVTASERDGAPAPFDTRGDWIDGAAPGVDILSTWPGYANAYGSSLRDYAVSSGTSFAAPLVTGLAGLALSLDSTLAAGDFRELFRRTLRHADPASTWRGIADAPALLAALSPPHRWLRGEAAATSWWEDGAETLHVRGSGFWRPAGAVDGDYPARRLEVRAVPRGAAGLDSGATWVRSVGAGGWRPGALRDGEECWGEAVEETAQGDVVLRTFVYRVDAPPAGCDSCPPLGWMPRPPWEVSLPWTRWGRERPTAAARPAPGVESISAVPARGAISFRVTTGPAGVGLPRSLVVFDPRGRRVSSLVLRPASDSVVTAMWRGQDEAGRIAPAGVYFVRYQEGASRAATRFLWLR